MHEQTPEQIGREAGEAIANAIADNLEAVILKLTEAIALVHEDQVELREDLTTLAREHSGLNDAYEAHLATLHRGQRRHS